MFNLSDNPAVSSRKKPVTASNPTELLMVRLLAQADAIFWPFRLWRGTSAGVSAGVHAARCRFAEMGLLWQSRERSEKGRKRSQRALDELADMKKVAINRSSAKKAFHVKLTDLADLEARRLAGSPGLYDCWLMMLELADVTEREPELLTDAWMSERAFPGECKDMNDMNGLTSMLLPGLVRGWVASASDVNGNVYYQLTSAGWQMLEGPEVAPEAEQEPSASVESYYFEQRHEALSLIESTVAEDRSEIGIIPFPASPEGMRFSKAWG